VFFVVEKIDGLRVAVAHKSRFPSGSPASRKRLQFANWNITILGKSRISAMASSSQTLQKKPSGYDRHKKRSLDAPLDPMTAINCDEFSSFPSPFSQVCW
jgi:hypothetical protein